VIRTGVPRALEAPPAQASVAWRWVDKPAAPARGPRSDEPTPWGAYVGIVLFGLGLLTIGVTGGMHRWAPPPVPSASAASPPVVATQSRPARKARAGSVFARAEASLASVIALRHALAGPSRSAELGRGVGRSVRTSGRAGPAPMSRSVPVSVRIPAIGVSAHIISVGLTASGGVGVPSLSTPMLVGWYDRGAAPGQSGPAVLVGHVDAAATGPAVFYELGNLRPGDLIYVTRADHRTAVFKVTSVALYSQWDFPERQVYGATSVPALRLVTCGGDFDEQTHLYLDRTVALAAYAGQAG
jgi:hypothetical protein